VYDKVKLEIENGANRQMRKYIIITFFIFLLSILESPRVVRANNLKIETSFVSVTKN